MISRLQNLDPQDLDPHDLDRGDLDRGDLDPGASIDAWLGVLTTMLHMPEARRRAIRDELSEHLHQRCRELVLGGAQHADAVRQAVGELGEAADLARRLDRAHRSSRRRIIMHVSVLGLGAAVVSTAVLTLTAGHPVLPPSVFNDVEAQRQAPAGVASERMTLTEMTTYEEVFDFLAAAHDMPLLIDWRSLESVGFAPDDAIGLRAESMSVPRVLELLSHIDEVDRLDWRYREEGLEVSLRAVFDHREVTLASYDISGALFIVTHEEITDLLHRFASPDDWEENGGQLARHQIVGDRLFIEAPPRVHRRAQWLLSELASGDEFEAAVNPLEPQRAVGALAPGDVLTIEVYELFAAGQWYKATRRIEADGTVRFPYLGELPVAGLRTRDVEAALTERAATLLQDPMVTVYEAVELPGAVARGTAGARGGDAAGIGGGAGGGGFGMRGGGGGGRSGAPGGIGGAGGGSGSAGLSGGGSEGDGKSADQER